MSISGGLKSGWRRWIWRAEAAGLKSGTFLFYKSLHFLLKSAIKTGFSGFNHNLQLGDGTEVYFELQNIRDGFSFKENDNEKEYIVGSCGIVHYCKHSLRRG
jgi:hypothetical protein